MKGSQPSFDVRISNWNGKCRQCKFLDTAIRAGDAGALNFSLGEEGTSAGDILATAADAVKKGDSTQKRRKVSDT